MKKYILFTFLLSFTFVKTFGQTPLEEFNNRNRPNSPGEVLYVSLIQLIANPEKFDGKVVHIKGFLRLEFEGTAIYIHQQDYQHRMSKNAIWVNLSRESTNLLKAECNDKYVSIIGTFKSEPKGHFGMYSGIIIDMRGIFPEDDDKD